MTVFENNGYLKSFVGHCIKMYFDKVFIKKEVVMKASKMELICVLSFIGKKSLQLGDHLINPIENDLNFCYLPITTQI